MTGTPSAGTGEPAVVSPPAAGDVGEGSPSPAAPSFRGNLVRRVVTALVALPAVVAVLFADAPWGAALGAFMILLGLLEFFRLLEARGLEPHRTAGLALATVLFLEAAFPGRTGPTLWPLLALVLLVSTLMRGRDLESAVPSAAGTLLGAVYLGALGGALVGLRTVPPVEHGAWRITFLLAIVMGSDTMAFFVGHALGRRRLAPSISPGKTVEGAVGGLLGGALGALAWRDLGLREVPVLHAVLLGVAVTALGIAGDLLESLLKRWARVKDSGTLLPGHGGVLDRLDSLLFGAPVLYYYFVYGPR